MAYRGISKLTGRSTLVVVLRYGSAVFSVAIALTITLILRHFNSPPRFISHFTLMAIAIAFWCAGTGPGLLALLLSCLGVSILARNHLLMPDFPLGPFIIFFAVFSALIGWFSASLRRAKQLLTAAHDNLELQVAERTSELVEANDELKKTDAELRTREAALQRSFEEIQKLKDELYQENLALKEEIDQAFMFEEIVGDSEALRRVLAQLAKVAQTESTVLILGETGTGKELIARAIHKRSRRSGRAFVSVNCAALAPSLISSELFGHERGAFTGATQCRLGRFELADGGTIFLDEVGELPPETQVALLRVLQEREFERVGSTHPIQVDVRVIAATNRDLKAATASGAFRLDLFYRLNVFPIDVPPLRERRDDILVLVEYFVQHYARVTGKHIQSIDKQTLKLFQAYDWPGNIRELQNVIERSVILTAGDVLSVDESWLSKEPSEPSSPGEAPDLSADDNLGEREIIEAALAESRGRVAGPQGAAVKLGVAPSTLEHRIKALKIRKSQFKFR